MKRKLFFSTTLIVGVIISCVFFGQNAQAQVAPPSNLSVTLTTIKYVQLSWDAVADPSTVSGYIINRDGKVVLTTTSTSYTDNFRPLPGSSYCYTIVAADMSGTNSAPTPPVCTPPTSVGTAITPVDVVITTLSSNSSKITWRYPLSTEQMQEYEGVQFMFTIERSDDGGSTWSVAGNSSREIDPSDTTTPSFTDTRMTPGVAHKYRVTAYSFETGFSEPSAVVTLSASEDQSVPDAPTQLSETYRDVTDVLVSWADNSENENSFVVERSSGDTWSDFANYSQPNAGSTVGNFNLPSLSKGQNYSIRVRAVNSFGRSEPSNVITLSIPTALNYTEPVPSEHMLVVYNMDDPQSVDVKNYYLANRPGISSANVLGVHLPIPSLRSNGTNNQSIDKSLSDTAILNPLFDWLQSHSEKQIRYIVFMYGMPSIVTGYQPLPLDNNSLQYHVSRLLKDRGVKNGAEYKAVRMTRYTPDYYRGTTAISTHIDMGGVAATKAYIDKLKNVYNKMSKKSLILSARNAGISGDTYYFDDRTTMDWAMGREAKDAVLSENSSAKVQYKPTTYFTAASNVLGYFTHGTHNGLAKSFPTNGSVIFTGNSGWYILRTGESWNGIYDNINTGQSNPSGWFAENAFGGTNYANTPVGAVSHVREPGGDGINSKEFFSLWERGYLFIEAAWASRNTPFFMAIGDPFVINGGEVSVAPPPADTTAPIIRTVSPSGTLVSTATSASLSVTTDENAICRYSTVSSTAFGASGSTLFSSTGEKTHTSTVSNLSAGVSYTYYVRCQDGSSNTNTSDHPVLFAVAALVQEVDTTSPNVFITYPIAQQIVRESSIVLTASASDSGGISGVTFYVDGQSVGNEDTTSPYSKMVTLSEGSHRVHAVARDVAGNRATSGSVTFTVRITAPEQLVVPEIRPPVTNTKIDPDLLAQERAAYVEYLRSTSVKTTNLSDDKPSDKKSDKKAKELVRLSKNFDLGDEDPEIVLLQKTLNTLGYIIAEEGPGSKDNETSRFDEKTREALIRYQSKYTESGISATGELDNVTIVLLNKDIDRLVEQAELYDEEISAQNAENSSGFISSITSFIDSVVGGIADFIVGLFW